MGVDSFDTFVSNAWFSCEDRIEDFLLQGRVLFRTSNLNSRWWLFGVTSTLNLGDIAIVGHTTKCSKSRLLEKVVSSTFAGKLSELRDHRNPLFVYIYLCFAFNGEYAVIVPFNLFCLCCMGPLHVFAWDWNFVGKIRHRSGRYLGFQAGRGCSGK